MARAVISVSLDQDSLKIVDQAEAILKKEGKNFNLSAHLQKLVKKHLIDLVKDHGDGNPGSSIDQFFDEGFMVTPALARASNPQYIADFLKSIQGTKQFEEIGVFLTTWVQQYNTLQEPTSL